MAIGKHPGSIILTFIPSETNSKELSIVDSEGRALYSTKFEKGSLFGKRSATTYFRGPSPETDKEVCKFQGSNVYIKGAKKRLTEVTTGPGGFETCVHLH